MAKFKNFNFMINFRTIKNRACEVSQLIYLNETSNLINENIEGKEGKVRKFSENLIEKIVQGILKCIAYYSGVEICSKRGDEDEFVCKQNGKYAKYKVDRHNYVNGVLNTVIENKSNLDSAYLVRAFSDFVGISYSLAQSGLNPSKVKAAIVAGVQSIKNDSYSVKKNINYDRHPDSKMEVETFYLFKGKRSLKNPLYNGDYTINENGIDELIDYLMSGIVPKFTEEEMNNMKPFEL